MKKNIKTIIFLLIIFSLAFSVWSSPIIFKGYSPDNISSPIILARNISQTNLYSMGNDLDVILAPSLIQEQGQISDATGKFSSIAYSNLFKIIGLPEQGNIIFISIFIQALTLIILTLLILYLFNFKIASIFSLIYIFLPFNWRLPYSIGVYEFCLFFFALFFLLYFYGIRQKKEYFYLIPAGVFLTFSCLSKEVTFLFLPFFFIYLWIINQKRYLLYIFIPLLIILSFFWLPGMILEKSETFGLDYYGEFYPDPYTFHFEKEEFLQEHQEQLDNKELDFFERIRLIKSSSNTNVKSTGLIDRLKIGSSLILRHLSKFFAIEYMGGPLILLLIILGIYNLKQKNIYLYRFFLYWIASTLFLLSFIFLVGRSHLMDFGWVIALLIALGISSLIEILNNYFNLKEKSVFLSFGIILLILYNLVLANHVAWGKIFDDQQQQKYLLIQTYSQEIKSNNISDQDVIATPLEMNDVYSLNYLTNKSIVIFQPETIETILDKEELSSAFEKFGVKYILGYSEKLTNRIIEQSKVENISTNEIEIERSEVSPTKSWFLNLIK